MFDLSWFELPQLHVFNAWFSGTGKTHVAAAVALAASANLPQKERCQHGRMPLRDEIRLQMLWPFLDFSKNRRHQTRFCNWSWWIMTNIMTYHDIWKYQYMSRHMKEKSLNLQTFELLVSSLHLHPSLFCYFLESRNASCVSRNPMQRQSTCTNDWRWISTGRLVFQRDIWLDMTHMSHLIHLFFFGIPDEFTGFWMILIEPQQHSKPKWWKSCRRNHAPPAVLWRRGGSCWNDLDTHRGRSGEM